MKKMTKKHWAAIGRFADEATKVLEARGIAVAEKYPFDPKAVDSNLSLEAVAMTKFGRLDIVVRHWIHTRFELPNAAARETGCNPHSGKWNFHFRDELFEAVPTEGSQDYLLECVQVFAANLDRVEAREWTTYPVTVSKAEVDAHSKLYWERRRAMGEEVSIEGFDREGAKEFLATHWTDVEGNISPEFESMSRAWLSHADDIDVHFHVKSFIERSPDTDMPDFYDTAHEMAI